MPGHTNALFREYIDSCYHLYLLINLLYEWIDEFGNMGFCDYTPDSIRGLQISLRCERDKMWEFSEKIERIAKPDIYADCKNEYHQSSDDKLPIFFRPEAVGQIHALLSSVCNRFDLLSNALDLWPDVDAELFVSRLNNIYNDLNQCRTLIRESEASIDENDASPKRAERPEEASFTIEDNEDEDEAPVFRNLPIPDNLAETADDNPSFSFTLNPDAQLDDFNTGEAYNTMLVYLRKASTDLKTCLTESASAQQLFPECQPSLLEDIAAARSACESCYYHSELFDEWLESAIEGGVCPRPESSPASLLLDVISELSSIIDTLSTPTDDSDRRVNSGAEEDEFDLYKELDRRFQELYGTTKSTLDEDDRSESPIRQNAMEIPHNVQRVKEVV